jgi:hypothetical protein
MVGFDITNIIVGSIKGLVALVPAAVLGLAIRESFKRLKQPWASSNSSIILFGLLPVATFAITSVISDNIALSLGMVGALSIVRFRNPVRSPTELTAYFILIAIGICLTRNTAMAIALTIAVVILAFLIDYSIKRNHLSSKGFFGIDNLTPMTFVTAKTSEKLAGEFTSVYLTNLTFFQKITSETASHEYRWEFQNRADAHVCMEELESSKIVIECAVASPN